MKSKGIPEAIKGDVEEIVKRFNEKTFVRGFDRFLTRYSGKHLYLDLLQSGMVSPRCRLTFAGKIDDWEFAIFKSSSESYSSKEWMFPGFDHVDGTTEGALRAALAAYS